MKYRVGDRVRVRKDLNAYKVNGVIKDMEKLKGKIVTISECETETFYRLEGFDYHWTDEMFEGLAEYTYEDLCKAPVGTKVTFENRKKTVIKTGEDNLEDELGVTKIYNLKGLKDNGGSWGKIIKIEEPSYTTVYEAKEILDEKEREYLSNVIKPFKKQIKYIKKCVYYDERCAYLQIVFKNDVGKLTFPDFESCTMYREMEVSREYSLEELGLN